MVMFFGVDGIAWGRFEVEWGTVISVLKAIWAGLSFAGDALVVRR
jgi:hypothetical protein